jgi:hypothetical protein
MTVIWKSVNPQIVRLFAATEKCYYSTQGARLRKENCPENLSSRKKGMVEFFRLSKFEL